MKCHRGCVSSKWQEIVRGAAERSADQSDASLLGEFYELLLSTWHTEVSWCAVIFGKDEAPAIVAQLLLEVTLSVESGPAVLISNSMQGQASEKLQILSDLHKITSRFVINLQKALSDDSRVEKIDKSMLAKLADAFWHAYVPFLLQYKDLEQGSLLVSLSDIPLDAHDVIDLVQILEASVKKLFDHARAAFDRCDGLTGIISWVLLSNAAGHVPS